MKPRALDLFCGAGGATRGLQLAGFHVTGVDIKASVRYVGDAFHQADAMTFPLGGFDFIWTSPPCQRYSIAARKQRNEGTDYPDLVAGVRKRLRDTTVPWVIENVPGAPLGLSVMLCGSYFGLPIVRHRYFECSHLILSHHSECTHVDFPITVCGHGTPSWMRQKRIKAGLHPNASVAMKRSAMGIDWMDCGALSQAIPPAYAKYIGDQMMPHVLRGMKERAA